MLVPLTGLLIMLSLLSGLATVFLMLIYAFRRKTRTNRTLTIAVAFATVGFVIAFMFATIGLIRNDDSAFNAGLLWPTSMMLGAGEGSDAFGSSLFVFGLATLSNIGVYGALGLFVGLVWNWIGPRKVVSSKGES